MWFLSEKRPGEKWFGVFDNATAGGGSATLVGGGCETPDEICAAACDRSDGFERDGVSLKIFG